MVNNATTNSVGVLNVKLMSTPVKRNQLWYALGFDAMILAEVRSACARYVLYFSRENKWINQWYAPHSRRGGGESIQGIVLNRFIIRIRNTPHQMEAE